MFMILTFSHITVLKYFFKIKTDYPASSNLYTLTYYKSENRSSLYTSVFSISSKLSFTVTTSSLYVIPYQVSLLRNTLTDILFSANNSPIKVGIIYSAFIGSAGTSFLKESTNPTSKVSKNAGVNPHIFIDTREFTSTATPSALLRTQSLQCSWSQQPQSDYSVHPSCRYPELHHRYRTKCSTRQILPYKTCRHLPDTHEQP